MKRYYNFIVMLCPQEKVVKDIVVYMTEEEMHEASRNIVRGLDESGMSFNGKNANHHYVFLTKDIDKEYREMKAAGF